MENKRLTAATLDKNMIIESAVGESDVVFLDVRKDPFDLYGFYNARGEADFKRLPDEIAQATNEGVAHLYRNTAGGRVRFCTDSPYVAIRAEMPTVCKMSHMAFTGSIGFDLFLDDPESGKSRFYRCFRPKVDIKDGYESKIGFPNRQMRYITINFPTYSDVKNLWIGVSRDAQVGGGMKYRDLPPIVYYGSSITQGGCAERPGNVYQAIISRRFPVDFLNLGFSGSGRAEEVIVNYMAGLRMSAFVSDYDHNAPDEDYLRMTCLRMYRTIRAANPDLPYLLVSRPDFDVDVYDRSVMRRDAVYETFRTGIAQGDRNLYYIDGSSIFRGPYEDLCTVDGAHPNDLGFALMADAIGAELERILTKDRTWFR